jgi:hypothetical protein
VRSPPAHKVNLIPSLDDTLLAWLEETDPSPEGDPRVDALAKVLVPPSWERTGSVFPSRGHVQFLIQIQEPGWHTTQWTPEKPLSECFDIHLEVDIRFGFQGGQVPCRLHRESSPYMPRKELEGLRVDIRPFDEFTDRFARSLHRHITGTPWMPTRNRLQKARLDCPLLRDTTVAEFQSFLLPRIEGIKPAVRQAIADAIAGS